MKRPVQYFSKEYLQQCRHVSAEETLEFLENFRLLHSSAAEGTAQKSKLISIKIPEPLLKAFQAKAKVQGIAYQTQIKVLMKQWLGIK